MGSEAGQCNHDYHRGVVAYLIFVFKLRPDLSNNTVHMRYLKIEKVVLFPYEVAMVHFGYFYKYSPSVIAAWLCFNKIVSRGKAGGGFKKVVLGVCINSLGVSTHHLS